MSKNNKGEHHFDVEDAIKYGVEKAVILHNLRFWLTKNLANKTNKHTKDCKTYYWTFNSSRAFGELFPYLTESSIQRWLKELEKDGELIVGSFNKLKYDRTRWYSTPDYEIETLTQIEETLPQNGECIPQNGLTIPDSKQQILNTDTPPSVEEEFSSERDIQKLLESKYKPDKVRWLYFTRKKMTHFENKAQFKATMKRNLRAAQALMGYDSDQIEKTMDYCEEKWGDNYGWTLETVGKQISNIINKR